MCHKLYLYRGAYTKSSPTSQTKFINRRGIMRASHTAQSSALHQNLSVKGRYWKEERNGQLSYCHRVRKSRS